MRIITKSLRALRQLIAARTGIAMYASPGDALDDAAPHNISRRQKSFEFQARRMRLARLFKSTIATATLLVLAALAGTSPYVTYRAKRCFAAVDQMIAKLGGRPEESIAQRRASELLRWRNLWRAEADLSIDRATRSFTAFYHQQPAP